MGLREYTGGHGAQKAGLFVGRWRKAPPPKRRTTVRLCTVPTPEIIYIHMELSPQEIVLLGTAIAFELSRNQTPQSLQSTCALLNQVLFTLSNLIKN